MHQSARVTLDRSTLGARRSSGNTRCRYGTYGGVACAWEAYLPISRGNGGDISLMQSSVSIDMDVDVSIDLGVVNCPTLT